MRSYAKTKGVSRERMSRTRGDDFDTRTIEYDAIFNEMYRVRDPVVLEEG